MQDHDFYYEISDERLIAYSRVSLLDRLKWLDEVRRFTLAVRAAPTVDIANPQKMHQASNKQGGATPRAA